MVGNAALQSSEVHLAPSERDLDEIKWCTVTLSDVVRASKRLEASVFEVEGKHAREQIASCKYSSVPLYGKDGLATAYNCARFKRVWVPHSKFPIYQPSTILDLKPEPDGYISDKTATNIDSLRVTAGQILITCSGTVGKTGLVTKTLDNKIFSHDLIRLNVNNPKDTGYIYAFLRSKIGNKLLQANQYGAVITHIEPEHLADIPVPNPPDHIKAIINELISHSFELRDSSNELIDKATSLLVNELSLPDINDFKVEKFNPKVEANNFSVKLSQLSNRVDASYHVPITKAIIEHLKLHADEVTTLGDRRISKEIILPGRFKRIYVEEGQGRVFFGGKQILELDPTNKKYLSLVQHGDRIKKQLELKENMTIITCSGTIGKVALVPRHWENWTANQHIIRVVPASMDIAGYLSIFLSSAYGYQFITRFTYGSVVDEIDDKHVAQIPFPLLKNKDIQQEINSLMLEANAKRYEAYLSEQKALSVFYNDVIYVK